MAESKKVVVERGLPRVVEIRNAAGAAGQAVSSGAGVPSTTPSAVGDVYVDTTNDNAYVATGTASSADWKQATGAGGGDLLAANNLSELTATAATARSNIGAGVGDFLANGTVTMAGNLDMGGFQIQDVAIFLDSSLNTILGITTKGASAVNYLDIANALAGAGPTITALGTDANIDINLIPKGSGDVNITPTGDINLSAAGTKVNSSGDISAATTIELGHATDTTLSRVSAGVAAIEGSNIIVSGGALGTPASGVATNLTGTAAGLTVGATTGVEAGADVTDATNVTAAGALMDSECASLADVKALNQSVVSGAGPSFTSAQLTTPVLGTPTSGVLTNCTGLPEAGGGTNQSTYAQGDILYASATNTLAKLAKGTTGQVLTQTATIPEWAAATGGGGATVETSIYVDAAAMTPEDGAAGPTAETVAGGTSGADIDVLLFAELETAYFKWVPPPQYDGGNVTIEVFWAGTTGASAADKVKWGVAALSVANDEDWDGTAFPAPDEAEDSVTAFNDLHTIEITAVTTSWNDGEQIIFELERTAAAATKMAEEARLWGVRIKYNNTAVKVAIGIAASDETTALTTGTAKATYRMPYAFELTDIRASMTTAPVTGTPAAIVDVNVNGTTLMTTDKLDFDTTEKTTETAATQPTLTTTTLASDDEITVDIDQVGSGTAGAGLKVWLIGYITD